MEKESRNKDFEKSFAEWKKSQGLAKSTKVFILKGPPSAEANGKKPEPASQNSILKHLRNRLIQRGWVENEDVLSPYFDLKWAPPHTVGWDSLYPSQMVNSVPKIRCITCKRELCRNARALAPSSKNSARTGLGLPVWEWLPECYDVSINSHLQSFTVRFRILHAQSILGRWLKWLTPCEKAAGILGEELFAGLQSALEEWVSADGLDVESYVISAALRVCQRALNGEAEDEICGNKDWSLLSTAFEPGAEVDTRKRKNNPKQRLQENKELFRDVARCICDVAASEIQWSINGWRNAWIVKPGAAARGHGIEVMRSFHGILQRSRSSRKVPGGTSKSWVNQKYVENPLLLPLREDHAPRHKHDLRVWVLVVCREGVLRSYIWSGPYIRLSAGEWHECTSMRDRNWTAAWSSSSDHPHQNSKRAGETDEERRRYMHLTNFCISKHKDPGFVVGEADAPSDGPAETPYIWDVVRYSRYLKKRFGSDVWTEKLWPRIHEVCYSALIMAKPFLEPVRPNSWQVLGYDLIVTADLGVWCCEVNSSPDLSATFPLKDKQVDALFEGVLQRVLPPEAGGGAEKTASTANPEEIGNFEEMPAMFVDSFQPEPISKRRPGGAGVKRVKVMEALPLAVIAATKLKRPENPPTYSQNGAYQHPVAPQSSPRNRSEPQAPGPFRTLPPPGPGCGGTVDDFLEAVIDEATFHQESHVMESYMANSSSVTLHVGDAPIERWPMNTTYQDLRGHHRSTAWCPERSDDSKRPYTQPVPMIPSAIPFVQPMDPSQAFQSVVAKASDMPIPSLRSLTRRRREQREQEEQTIMETESRARGGVSPRPREDKNAEKKEEVSPTSRMAALPNLTILLTKGNTPRRRSSDNKRYQPFNDL